MKQFVVILLTVLTRGCGSKSATHFCSLDPIHAGQRQPSPVAVPIQVAAVHVPSPLDREEMVRQTGSNTLDVSNQDRWSASPGTATPCVRTQGLIDRISKTDIILADQPFLTNAGKIVVAIMQRASHG